MLAELGDSIDPQRVLFPGRLEYATYRAMLQRSDAHVYLTYPFVASWSLREALATGCAVIGGNTPTVSEFVTHGENGLLVPFLDSRRLADAVLEVLEDAPLARRLREGARAFAEKTLAMGDYIAASKPVAAVFIWRSPLSVARSLQGRDGMHLADGVALWERYNRSALTGLVGVDTFVLRYESIVEDPLGKLGELIGWFEDLPQFAPHVPHWDRRGASAGISPELLRQHGSDESKILLGEQSRLVEHLDSLTGPHQPFDSPPPGAESPWTTAVLGDRQQLAVLSLQRDMLRDTVREQTGTGDRGVGRDGGGTSETQALQAELERVQAEL